MDRAAARRKAPIRVAVRCRPADFGEGDACVDVGADGTIAVRSGEEEATFTFDASFGASAAQIDVYTELVTGPMAALFDGFNATIVAYGQTGSGKTFSLMGGSDPTASPASRVRTAGIIPRFGAELFDRVGKLAGASVSASYAQLYNENFRDLLEPGSAAELKLRRSEARGVHVAGLSEKRLHSAKELLQLLARADAQRAGAAPEVAARTHTILTLAITLPVAGDGHADAAGAAAAAAAATAGGGNGGGGVGSSGGKAVTVRATLVDLAGSGGRPRARRRCGSTTRSPSTRASPTSASSSARSPPPRAAAPARRRRTCTCPTATRS